MSEFLQIPYPACLAANRVPTARLAGDPFCNWLAIPHRFTIPVAILHLLGWIPAKYFAACRAHRQA